MTVQGLKYFIYARKSTEEEERQLLSIPAQLSELKTFASKEKLSVVDTLIESKTAKQPGRKVFNEMLEKVQAGEADGIISWHPDRLARNAVDAGMIIHLLDNQKLLDLKFPTLVFQNNPQGLFMLSISFGQSKYYIDNLSENTKRGLRQKVKSGGYPSQAPIGYLNDTINKTILVDKSTVKYAKQAFKLYSKASYTLQSISDFLFDKGVKTRSGRKISKDRVKMFLTNPFYYGHFRYNGEIYQGKHQPIITKKLFDQVQSVIKKRGFSKPPKPHNLPFAGFMKCGECGYTITAETKTKHYKGTNRKVTYVYYRCSKKGQYCSQPFLRKEKLIKQVNKHIKSVSLPQNIGQMFLRKLKHEEKQLASSWRATAKKIDEQIKLIKTKLETLLDAHLDQLVNREEYLTKKNKLMSQKKSLEEKLSSLSQSYADWLGPFREWIFSALSAKKISEENKNLFEKRSFLINTGSDFVLRDKKLRTNWQKPWAAVRGAAKNRNWERETGIEPATFSLKTRCSTFLRASHSDEILK